MRFLALTEMTIFFRYFSFRNFVILNLFHGSCERRGNSRNITLLICHLDQTERSPCNLNHSRDFSFAKIRRNDSFTSIQYLETALRQAQCYMILIEGLKLLTESENCALNFAQGIAAVSSR